MLEEKMLLSFWLSVVVLFLKEADKVISLFEKNMDLLSGCFLGSFLFDRLSILVICFASSNLVSSSIGIEDWLLLFMDLNLGVLFSCNFLFWGD